MTQLLLHVLDGGVVRFAVLAIHASHQAVHGLSKISAVCDRARHV